VIHAAEVFAVKNELLHHENNGLRNAIKEEKRRRKRGKPLGLMDEVDIQGHALFFSPAKVERARQRFREREETEQREKQTKADQRLQQAILQAERRQEKKERQITLTAQRVANKKEKEQLKAEMRTKREQQRNQRATVKAQRRQEIEGRKQQRAQAKEAREQAALARKRRVEVNGQDGVPKRRRLNHLQALAEHRTHISRNSTPQPSISVPETVIRLPQPAFSAPVPAEEEEGSISRQSRCGRRVKLPTRFK
jgi:hypothetical protein